MAFKINGLDIKNLKYDGQEVLTAIFNGDIIFKRITDSYSSTRNTTLFFTEREELGNNLLHNYTYSYSTSFSGETISFYVKKPDSSKQYSDFLISNKNVSCYISGSVGNAPLYIDMSCVHSWKYVEDDNGWTVSATITPSLTTYTTDSFESRVVVSASIYYDIDFDYSYITW